MANSRNAFKMQRREQRIELPCFTDSKTSIFPHVNTLEIKLGLMISGIFQSFGPRSCHHETGKSWPWANFSLSYWKHFNWVMYIVVITCEFNCHLKCLLKDYTLVWHWNKKLLCMQKGMELDQQEVIWYEWRKYITGAVTAIAFLFLKKNQALYRSEEKEKSSWSTN